MEANPARPAIEDERLQRERGLGRSPREVGCGPWSLLAQFPAPLAGPVLARTYSPPALAGLVPARTDSLTPPPPAGLVLARVGIPSPSGD
ncbi:hypothetical protein ABZ734_24430 [Streptomyces sp. NPDC006660]|uniref:hypothetical protein n=1 Tax=Streptomyces sp. NPDC006660 TaxID=3156901 RepID=UPI0033C260C4